jgi:hypothetical protein
MKVTAQLSAFALTCILAFISCALPKSAREVRGCVYVGDDPRWVGDTISISVDTFSLLKSSVYYTTESHIRPDTSLCFTLNTTSSGTTIQYRGMKAALNDARQTLYVSVNSRHYYFNVSLLDAPYILISGYDFDSIPRIEPDSVILILHDKPFVFE